MTTPEDASQILSNPDYSETLTPGFVNHIVCFDPDDMSSRCPVCGGMGLVKYNVPVDHPKFGKLLRCPNYPAEVDVARQERLRRVSNLGAFHECHFDNFELTPPGYTDSEQQSLIMAHQAALRFSEDMQGWLLLEGTYGSGKTHLAAAVGNIRLAKGELVLFVTTPDLLDHLRSAFSPSSETTYDEMFERVKNATLLILDDLGVENPSPWAQEKLFQLLNHRYSHMKPTIITTNNSVDDLDPRIRSRLLDLEMVRRQKISAPDYRSKTSNENDQLLSRLHLYADMNFQNFDIHQHVTPDERQNLHNVSQIVADFAENPAGWLLLVGGYGTGKTHLAAAIANHTETMGKSVMFITAPDLLDYLRTTFDPSAKVSFDALFNQVRNIPMLVLDDLNTKQGSSWSREKLFQLLDYRYIARYPTIITTSQPFGSLDERLQTRFADRRVCRVAALKTRAYVNRLQGRQ
ncbi:MAG: ATP-binding protein [Aggregatilineales bacterium]